MKSLPRGSLQRLASFGALRAAWARLARDKRRRPDVARFDLHAEEHLSRLAEQLLAGTWRPGPVRVRVVRDPKLRCVVIAPLEDRVVHQAVVAEVGAWHARTFSSAGWGCLPDRGPHRCLLRALAHHRRHPWVVALDVRRFFPSLPHEALLRAWGRGVRDEDTLALLAHLVEAGGRVYRRPEVRAVVGPVADGHGLSVGSYFSHFSAALVLDGLDQHMLRVQRVGRRGCAWLRYMDDALLHAPDPQTAAALADVAAAWLAGELGLSWGRRDGPSATQGRPVAFLGHLIGRAGVRPSRKLRRNLGRGLDEAARRGPAALERTLASYRGLVVVVV